jgi:hypothetical protein
MSAPLTHEDFQPHVGCEFRFGGQPQVLRLSRIDVMDRPPLPGMGYKAFTLVFAGPRGDVLPEGFYAAEADGGARFEFYIMPIHTPAPDRQEYQAVFN